MVSNFDFWEKDFPVLVNWGNWQGSTVIRILIFG